MAVLGRGGINICFSCVNTFLVTPKNAAVIILSFVLAIFLIFVLMKKKEFSNYKKLVLIYGHLFFLSFPFIFYSYSKTCGRVFYSCGYSKALIYSLPVALLIAVIGSFLIAPFFFTFSLRKLKIGKGNMIHSFVEQFAQNMKLRMPQLYLLNRAEPVAFSFSHISPRIFVSVGLLDLLKQKEVEAVLLHEVGHLKYRSSLLKLGDSLLRFLSPISAFHVLDGNFRKWLEKEELKADAFAVQAQGTERHLASAKAKINKFFEVMNGLAS